MHMFIIFYFAFDWTIRIMLKYCLKTSSTLDPPLTHIWPSRNWTVVAIQKSQIVSRAKKPFYNIYNSRTTRRWSVCQKNWIAITSSVVSIAIQARGMRLAMNYMLKKLWIEILSNIVMSSPANEIQAQSGCNG